MSGHFVGLLGAEASSCVEDTQTKDTQHHHQHYNPGRKPDPACA
jgi:hypothetical protein